MTNEYYDKLAEKYLNRYFTENIQKKSAINVFYRQIIEETIKEEKNYLHAHPLVFSWCISSECNLRCKHCFFADDSKKYDSSSDLSTQEALKLVDSLDELNIYHVKVSGGEPFLRKDILGILKKLKSKNFSVAIQTNATLIDKNLAKEISQILIPNIDIVQVSIDGANRDTHELTRGRNTFDKTINGIKNLIENNICVHSSSVMTSLNIREFPKLYEMIKEMGVKTLAVGNFKVCNENQKFLVPDFKLKLEILNELIDMETPDSPLELSAAKIYEFVNNNIGLEFLKKAAKKNLLDVQGKNIICTQHNKILMAGNGNVYLCEPTATSEFCLGNIKNQSLLEIWNNRCHNLFFQEKLYDTFPCKNCDYYSICNSGCPMTAYLKYNTVNAPDANCIYGEKIMENYKKTAK